MLDRSLAGAETGELAEEIVEFQENLQALEGAGKAAVAEILSSTEQIFACLIPDDITEQVGACGETARTLAGRDRRSPAGRWRRLL